MKADVTVGDGLRARNADYCDTEGARWRTHCQGLFRRPAAALVARPWPPSSTSSASWQYSVIHGSGAALLGSGAVWLWEAVGVHPCRT